MERKYPHLCKPIRIGNVWYRNRMFSTPMGGTDGRQTSPSRGDAG